jgi:hypothetical protein
MRLPVVLASLLTLANGARADAVPVPYVQQNAPTTCAAAAFTMAARAAGARVEFVPLLRSVFVGPDGVAWLDLADAGVAFGLETLVIQVDRAGLDALVDSGQAVIVSVVEGGAKHAVVVTGREAGEYRILDSARPGRTRLGFADLDRIWARGQAVVVVGVDRAPRTPRWDDFRRQNRRFRAIEWGIRADAAAARGGDPLALYGRAISEDSTIGPLYAARARLLERRGDLAAAARDRRRAAELGGREAVEVQEGR